MGNLLTRINSYVCATAFSRPSGWPQPSQKLPKAHQNASKSGRMAGWARSALLYLEASNPVSLGASAAGGADQWPFRSAKARHCRSRTLQSTMTRAEVAIRLVKVCSALQDSANEDHIGKRQACARCARRTPNPGHASHPTRILKAQRIL